MDWNRLGGILKNSSLDRETKLMIIDLLALEPDQMHQEKIAKLVFNWEEADSNLVENLLDTLDTITTDFDNKKEKLDQKKHSDMVAAVDRTVAKHKVDEIRDHIETL
jgi:hypothetical protein